MKKNLLIVPALLLAATGMLKAQTVVLSENFESTTGTAIPGTWTQSTLASDGGWKSGTGTTLSSTSFPIATHTRFLATNDDGCNCDKSNDFLKSPVMNLSAVTSAVLKFDVVNPAGTYGGDTEIGKVEVSTNGGTTWVVLETLTSIPDWAAHPINLTAYAGMSSIMIGFRYTDAGGWLYGMAIDNFMVYEPVAIDVAGNSLNMLNYVVASTPQSVQGVMTNEGGSTVTSMTLNYSIDGAAPVTQALSSLSIASLASYNFTHSTNWTPGTVGNHTVKVWASNINGSADMVHSNDTITKVVYAATSLAQRIPLYEGFSSSTCGPCAATNPGTHATLVANNVNTPTGMVNAVKYQMNYPGAGNDPAYTTESNTRHTFYGVGGIPHGELDGGYGFEGHPAGFAQSHIDDRYAVPSIFTIAGTASFVGSTVTVTGGVTSLIDLTNPNLKIMVALVEDHINSGDNAHGIQSNGETDWYDVMRKMIPSTTGTAMPATQTVSLTTPLNLTYTFGATPKIFTSLSDMKAIVWVQDIVTKEIFQSKALALTTSIDELNSTVSTFDIFPNPFTDFTTVAFTLKQSENVTLEAYNMLGELVSTTNQGVMNAGYNTVEFKSEMLAAGMYYIKVTAGTYSITKKVSINK
jgi:type IX secretion system substrate protein